MEAVKASHNSELHRTSGSNVKGAAAWVLVSFPVLGSRSDTEPKDLPRNPQGTD